MVGSVRAGALQQALVNASLEKVSLVNRERDSQALRRQIRVGGSCQS